MVTGVASPVLPERILPDPAVRSSGLQAPRDLLAAAADVPRGDLGGFLADLARDDGLEDFLGQTEQAIALAQASPLFAEDLDPTLARIRDALPGVPADDLSSAEQGAIERTLGRLVEHLGPVQDGGEVVPGGGLEAHEDAGSHLIERHVGKSEAELLDRLKRENISASSSFRTLPDAERYVAGTIAQNQEAIDAWLDGKGGNRLVLDGRFDSSTGISIKRGDTQAEDVYSVKLVLERSDALGIGYRIVTGYPTTP